MFMKSLIVALKIFILGITLTACGGTSVATVPPIDTALPPTDTAVPPTETPLSTSTPLPESEIDLGMSLAAGDPLLGELTALNYRCTGCHDNSAYPGVEGPEFSTTDELPPIMKRGEVRITDPVYEGDATTGREYIIESILSPAAYTVPGDWPKPMPETFHEEMTDEELADILAWLETFSAVEDAPTKTAVPPTSSPTPDITAYMQMDLSGGDALRGQNAALKYRCHGCHASDHPESGPPFLATEELPHILERGELRIADPAYEGQATTNLQYILESIFLPGVYVLPGEWKEAMPDTFAMRMTEKDLANIMAWIESLE
jgi:hypothetical protein